LALFVPFFVVDQPNQHRTGNWRLATGGCFFETVEYTMKMAEVNFTTDLNGSAAGLFDPKTDWNWEPDGIKSGAHNCDFSIKHLKGKQL
jgi:hypothetical protein